MVDVGDQASDPIGGEAERSFQPAEPLHLIP
jgi:hypothetical protein